jgi:hypothetical protein
MKIERSKQAAIDAINEVCNSMSIEESSRILSLQLMEIGFLHQFEKGDRKVVRDKIKALISEQMGTEI